METLRLGDNLLDESGIGPLASGKSALTELELSGNKLKTIPEGLFNITALRELSLSRNEISELPEALTRLQRIRTLDLADNVISSLPASISALQSLREFNLSYNRLTSLPPEFTKLTGLCVLHLMYNSLTEVPQPVRTMKQNHFCYHIEIEDNPIPESLPAEKNKRKRDALKMNAVEKLNRALEEKFRLVGISEMMGKRPRMEDTVSCHLSFAGLDGEDFFAVFDGHAGRDSAVFAADQFHTVLARKLTEERGAIPKAGTAHHKGKEQANEASKKKGSFWALRAVKKSSSKRKAGDEINARSKSSEELKKSGMVNLPKNGKEKEKEEENEEENEMSCEQGKTDDEDDEDEETISFPRTVADDSNKEAHTMFNILVNSFFEMDELMKKNKDGTTAVITLASMRLHKLFVANVGDTRAVLCRRGRAFALTVDHTPKLAAESERIRALNGFVTSNRVNGVIAISRSLGDAQMKPFVSAEPGTCVVDLCGGDQFLILACDGCWDVMDNQTAVDIVSAELAATGNPVKAAIKLRDQAYWQGSGDNISVIVVLLDKYHPSEHTSPSVTSSSSSLGPEPEKRIQEPEALISNFACGHRRAKKKVRHKGQVNSIEEARSEPNLSKIPNHGFGCRRTISDLVGLPAQHETDLSGCSSTEGPVGKHVKKAGVRTRMDGETVNIKAKKKVRKERRRKKDDEKRTKKTKKRGHLTKDSSRLRSRSVADAEESLKFSRLRVQLLEDAALSRQTRSSSVCEKICLDSCQIHSLEQRATNCLP